MIRISITPEAYLALGGGDKPPPQDRWEAFPFGQDDGRYYVWLTPQVAARLSHAREPGESSSDAILRLAKEEAA